LLGFNLILKYENNPSLDPSLASFSLLKREKLNKPGDSLKERQ
jgi:hypothetical protein